MHQYLLFDLDGTLTDPAQGITRCVQYALSYFGQPQRSPEELYCYIGPPLAESFEKYAGLTGDKIPQAVEKYRERFREKGMFENKVYPGIEQMLLHLRQQGKILAVATSKPEVFARRILEHFHLVEYFKEITGSLLDGTRVHKAEVVKEALFRLGLDEKDRNLAVMIGDRKHDINGAKENGLASVGVAFGYGGEEELKEAGADRVVFSVKELEELLLLW